MANSARSQTSALPPTESREPSGAFDGYLDFQKSKAIADGTLARLGEAKTAPPEVRSPLFEVKQNESLAFNKPPHTLPPEVRSPLFEVKQNESLA
ncbi:MAG: hypothetical protein ACP5D7_09635, partial [Limnospira sp.]